MKNDAEQPILTMLENYEKKIEKNMLLLQRSYISMGNIF